MFKMGSMNKTQVSDSFMQFMTYYGIQINKSDKVDTATAFSSKKTGIVNKGN